MCVCARVYRESERQWFKRNVKKKEELKQQSKITSCENENKIKVRPSAVFALFMRKSGILITFRSCWARQKYPKF